MTTPQEATTPVDSGNRMLAETPVEFTATTMSSPGGQRLALTLRTSSTTMTVFLTRDFARECQELMAKEIARMNGLILPP